MANRDDEGLRRAKSYRDQEAAKARLRAELLQRASDAQEANQDLIARDSQEFHDQREDVRRAREQEREAVKKRWQETAKEVTQRRGRDDPGPNDHGPEGDGPHRPDPRQNARDQQYARTVADYERVQREQTAEKTRSEKRAHYMREHHPEEYRAEEMRKAERAGQPLDVSGQNRDGVFRPTNEQRLEAQQRESQTREQAARHSRDQDRQRERDVEARDNRGETNDRAIEKRDKDQQQEAKRQASRDWYLARRAVDRERDRGR